MAAQKQATTLVGPDGREYKTTDRVEVVNLKARGYKVKPAQAAPVKTDAPKK